MIAVLCIGASLLCSCWDRTEYTLQGWLCDDVVNRQPVPDVRIVFTSSFASGDTVARVVTDSNGHFFAAFAKESFFQKYHQTKLSYSDQTIVAYCNGDTLCCYTGWNQPDTLYLNDTIQ